MKIIDRYIIKSVLYAFVFVVLIITFVIVMVDISEKMDDFVNHHVSFLPILGYYRDFSFWIIGIVSPLMMFIAVVFVTSQMAGRSELIAIFSSGVSFRRLLLPYFIATFLITIFYFILNGWVIPKANQSQMNFRMQYFNKTHQFRDNNIHMQLEPNVYFYLQSYNAYFQTGYKFSLERFENNRLIENLTADKIVWDSTKEKWTMESWKRYLVDSLFYLGRDHSARSGMSGDKLDTALAVVPNDFVNITREYSNMTLNELNAHIAKLHFRGTSGVEAFEMERHLRYSSPFVIFVLVFMGVVVSSKKTRGGTGLQVALGFLLSFILIIFLIVSRALAEAGSLPAVVAAWIPGMSFLVVTLLLYKYIHRV